MTRSRIYIEQYTPDDAKVDTSTKCVANLKNRREAVYGGASVGLNLKYDSAKFPLAVFQISRPPKFNERNVFQDNCIFRVRVPIKISSNLSILAGRHFQ